jgi:hypothetical protein
MGLRGLLKENFATAIIFNYRAAYWTLRWLSSYELHDDCHHKPQHKAQVFQLSVWRF